MMLLYGMMQEHLKANRGVEKWISSLPDSRVNRSVLQEEEKENRMNETCGQIPFALLEKSDQDTAILKMWQVSSVQWITPQKNLFRTSEPYSETWPKQGIMQDGQCWELTMLVHRTEEKGCGYWVTPTIDMGHHGGSGIKAGIRRWEKGKQLNLDQQVKIEMWGTPRNSDGMKGKLRNPQNITNHKSRLEDQVAMWPTPSATDYMGAKKKGIEIKNNRFVRISLTTGVEYGAKLTDAVHKWPTPTTRDHKDTGNSIQNKNVPVNSLLGRAVEPTKMKGSLDPEFVEYLMGYPVGLTGLKLLGMGKFQKWLEEHGIYYQEKKIKK
jgi:hypothetical protein